MCTCACFINIVSFSFLVMVEVQTANLLSEENCRAIFGDYRNWRSNLLQSSLRDTNTAFAVVRILESHKFSEESRALKGVLCVGVCEIGIALNCLSSQLPFKLYAIACMYTRQSVNTILRQYLNLCKCRFSECWLHTILSCRLVFSNTANLVTIFHC